LLSGLRSSPRATDNLASTVNTLRRSRTDRVFGGVCGGIARVTGMEIVGLAAAVCGVIHLRRRRPAGLLALMDFRPERIIGGGRARGYGYGYGCGAHQAAVRVQLPLTWAIRVEVRIVAHDVLVGAIQPGVNRTGC